MTQSIYPLILPTLIKDAAARLGKKDGVSLNQWIVSAVAQKVGVSETVAHFLTQRAGNATPSDMMDALNAAPDLAPSPQDAPA